MTNPLPRPLGQLVIDLATIYRDHAGVPTKVGTDKLPVTEANWRSAHSELEKDLGNRSLEDEGTPDWARDSAAMLNVAIRAAL